MIRVHLINLASSQVESIQIKLQNIKFLKTFSILSVLTIILAGCQTMIEPEQKPPAPPEKKADIHDPSGVIITPYDHPEIKRQRIVIPEQKTQIQKFDDGRDLPAFKKLMQTTQTAYANGKWNEAESAATQAQRLAPQSAETFLYLAMIANRKNQPANAESLALRGLSYAQTKPMKQQLWNVVLKAGQMQKKSSTIQKAQQAIKAL